jgi:fatty-acyl-CoA synthase
MNGQMMDFPLTLTHVLERSAKLFPQQQIATRLPGDAMHRYTYGECHGRIHRLAYALEKIGVGPGDRIGSLCWNTFRHLELYFAVPCFGAVLHTLNPRLAADQLAFIINHAGDQVVFVDAVLAPLLLQIREQIPCVRYVVVMGQEAGAPGMANAFDYEELLADAPADPFPWAQLSELDAAMTCYTSGTTGNPKGVLYTQRSLVLHTFSLAFADSFAISAKDAVLQVVPMFHANGWGIPLTAWMTGARIVMPGRFLQPADIAALIEQERITFTAGVPTIWMGLYGLLEKEKHDVSSLRLVVCAGSALPRQFIESFARKYGIRIMLAWGMTETTPIATVMSPRSDWDAMPDAQRFDTMARHGLPVPGVEVRVVDDKGRDLPWDGSTMGELQVRGPWVTSGYYADPLGGMDVNKQSFMDGWFRTGDVATIDAGGYIQIMDRTKDLVKSGGEWISSVDLENAIMGYPKVMEAAVIAAFHPKWQERPVACIAPFPQYQDDITKQEILDFLAPRVAKWWLPDDIIFIEAVPKTSVGKFNKRALRERFKDYVLPGAAVAANP